MKILHLLFGCFLSVLTCYNFGLVSHATENDRFFTIVEKDWEFQESQKNRSMSDCEAILELVERGKRLAENLDTTFPGINMETFSPLSEMERRKVYCHFRRQLRDMVFGNPLLKDVPLVFMKRNRFVCQMMHEYLGYYCLNSGI